MEQTTTDRLQRNKAFQSKLSWKRKEALEIKADIKTFFSDNFNVILPSNYVAYKHLMNSNYNQDNFTTIREEYSELISLYYTFNYCGHSFASLFENEAGNVETYTLAHTYSKHRFDPVWNMRKSNLIRNVYRNYLKESQIYKKYHPVHITLTLPHSGGLYKGNKFYAKELITAFNLIRKKDFWKKSVFGGEYGVEVKESKNKENGLHIHIHSLAFLLKKDVNAFRKKLKEAWTKETGADQIWCETVYFNKKDESGKYEMKVIDSKKANNILFEEAFYPSTTINKVCVKKKFYVDEEANEINKRRDLTPEQKEEEILNNYLHGILECIKYHFKFDAIKNVDKSYNVFLINEILKNTKKKRLYSRFGKFYNVESLNFNNLGKTKEEDVELSKASQLAINPFTKEEVIVENTQIVMFYPELQRRQSKSALNCAYDLINSKDKTIYNYLDLGQNITTILKNHFNALFNRSALQILENKMKSKKNKGFKADFALPEKVPDDYFDIAFNFDYD